MLQKSKGIWCTKHTKFLFSCGKTAGDGNRTRVTSLEGWSFTAKLHPQTQLKLTILYLLFTILLEIFNKKIEIT